MSQRRVARAWRYGLLFLGCASVASGATPGRSDRFSGSDIFRLEAVSDPQLRPDGRVVAYARRGFDLMADRGHSSIWLVDVDSGAQHPLATGAASAGSPRWSPDGTRLAYVTAGEDGRTELHVHWMAQGADARVADLADAPQSLAWSPDGRSLAFLMFVPEDAPKLGEAPPKPEGAKWAAPLEVITDTIYRSDGEGYLRHGRTHLFIVAADGGAPRQLTFGPYDEDGPLAFAADGKAVLLSGNRNEDRRLDRSNSQILSVGVADGEVTVLTKRLGPDHDPVVSPDGSRIAYLGYDDHLRSYENMRLYVMDRDGSHAHSLTDGLDRSVAAARWAADGKSLIVAYEEHAATRIARLTLDGHLQALAEATTLEGFDRPYEGGAALSVAAGVVAYTDASVARPADLVVLRGGHARQLTHLNADLLGARALAEPRPLAVLSSVDARPIDAWLALPPHAAAGEKLPLILEIHGGPFTHYGAVFATDVQLYAAAGYAVLYTNPRGSTSYGAEFANLIHHDYPSHDYDDLMSAVDAAIATGRIDPEQLFVTGGSGGGVLSAWIVGRTHRFKAAAVQKPVINWAAWVLTTDMYPYGSKYWFEKRPWDDPESYWRHSPLSLVGNVTTPTLLVVGDRDYRTPVSDAEQYYQALQLRGIPTTLVKVPGASHGGIAARPSQSAAKASAILAWFDRYRTAHAP